MRDGVLLTPDRSADILEGINRRTILEIAQESGISCIERPIDMTELYIADEIFVTGTSAYVASVSEIDGRTIGSGKIGSITARLRDRMQSIQSGTDALSGRYMTSIQ